MKRLIFIPLLMLTLIIPLVFTFGCRRDGGNGQEFCHKTLLVTLTVEASTAPLQTNYVFSPSFFLPDVEVSEIRNQWELIPGQITLVIELEHPGKQNVLDAIEALETRIDVAFAEVNGFDWLF